MKLGVIGGSGLYQIEQFTHIKNMEIETPFGNTSDEIAHGKINDTDIFFLPRHGKGHRFMPSEINHRANIFAMKKIGVTHIISISAVGSLKEQLKPKDIVIVDQYLDRTKSGGGHSFFGDGIVAHIAFADPVCPELANLAYETVSDITSKLKKKDKPRAHMGGTYVNMEGPAFSTKAESNLYRSWGMDVIGMTNIGEAKLAREAEICYCTAAMVTDYDCWHPEHDSVTLGLIIQNLFANVEIAKAMIAKIAGRIHSLKRNCSCPNALKSAIITSPECISKNIKIRLEPIIGKYCP
jgi:5'-methylthioadenosine phosphorylase